MAGTHFSISPEARNQEFGNLERGRGDFYVMHVGKFEEAHLGVARVLFDP